MLLGLENTVYPDAVHNALRECDTLAVEVDLPALDKDRKRLSEAMEILKCGDKSTREMLGDDYERVRDFLEEKRLYNALYENYLPAVWSSTLTTGLAEDCGYSSDYGTDRALLKFAKRNKIPIHELETVEEQYTINANMSEALQVYNLVLSVDTVWESQKSQVQKLYTDWASGDIKALEETLFADELPFELALDYAQFYYDMYESRQFKMAEYIAGELDDGEATFVAVGALHLAATPDILDYFQNPRYKVEDLT